MITRVKRLESCTQTPLCSYVSGGFFSYFVFSPLVSGDFDFKICPISDRIGNRKSGEAHDYDIIPPACIETSSSH